jgi:single-strand DNA-binding protein
MASFNKIIIVGYLGRDPEIRYSGQGTAICDFSVATTERRKDKAGEFQEVTTWFRVSLFGRQAEVAHQYLTKGRQVYVEGSLAQREWTDQNGATRTSLEVRGTDIQFISPHSENEQPQAASARAGAGESRVSTTTEQRKPYNTTSATKPVPARQANRVDFNDDEIPF